MKIIRIIMVLSIAVVFGFVFFESRHLLAEQNPWLTSEHETFPTKPPTDPNGHRENEIKKADVLNEDQDLEAKQMSQKIADRQMRIQATLDQVEKLIEESEAVR